MVLGFIGFFLSLVLLIIFTMRGFNIIIAAIVCSTLLALTSGLSLEKALTENYMGGFTGYFASWFLVYLFGAIFGKVMEETKAADSIAEWVKSSRGETSSTSSCCSVFVDVLWRSKCSNRGVCCLSDCGFLI